MGNVSLHPRADEIKSLLLPRAVRSLTPISKQISHYQGQLEGTGSYLKWQDKNYLLTCEHVTCKQRPMREMGLAHCPVVGGDFLRLFHTFSLTEPEDLGLFFDPVLPDCHVVQQPISLADFATTSITAPGELLFIAGFPQEYSTSTHTELFTRGFPFTTFEASLPDDVRFNNITHGAIHYPREGQNDSGQMEATPAAFAMSGSPVWNTRFIEGDASPNWSAADAKIIGIAWAWVDSKIIYTRVEKVREFLLAAFRYQTTDAYLLRSGETLPTPDEWKIAETKVPHLL